MTNVEMHFAITFSLLDSNWSHSGFQRRPRKKIDFPLKTKGEKNPFLWTSEMPTGVMAPVAWEEEVAKIVQLLWVFGDWISRQITVKLIHKKNQKSINHGRSAGALEGGGAAAADSCHAIMPLMLSQISSQLEKLLFNIYLLNNRIIATGSTNSSENFEYRKLWRSAVIYPSVTRPLNVNKWCLWKPAVGGRLLSDEACRQ